MKKSIVLFLGLVFLVSSCSIKGPSDSKKAPENLDKYKNYENASFAGGCFWCTESDFQKQEGVVEVISGYTGGHKENPTYEEVSSGTTGHRESILVIYDPKKISYEKLLEVFWTHVDPTDDGGQFVDRGFQYTSAIFYTSSEQKKLAEQSKKKLEESGNFNEKIVTEILPLETFYPAEDYHQDYFKKNPIRYNFYRKGSGRDKFLEEQWNNKSFSFDDEEEEEEDMKFTKPSDEQLKEILSDMQYYVTQKNGTEKAFDNEYWNNTREGIYVDVVSGEPLFSSKDKYKSGTGWPSFTKPIDEGVVIEKEDRKFFIKRTEIRSSQADSHLGHVFNDGPEESTGLRYCMNSAALRFIAKEDLEKEGYGEYLKLFE